jgi:hypothetical protein
MRNKQESKALIFSPKKIQQAREFEAKRQQEVVDEEAAKDTRKAQGLIKKQQKEQDLEVRCIERKK